MQATKQQNWESARAIPGWVGEKSTWIADTGQEVIFLVTGNLLVCNLICAQKSDPNIVYFCCPCLDSPGVRCQVLGVS
jgi:hypothetical protein